MGLFGGISSAIGNVVGTVAGGLIGKHEAKEDRKWQTDMSNNAIQRRVADMRAAGINPLLSVQGAATGAAVPQSSVRSGITPDAITGMINSMTQLKSVEADNKLKDTQAGLNVQKAITEEKIQKEKDLNNLLAGKKIDTEKLVQGYLAAQTQVEKQKVLNMIKEGKGIDAQTQRTIRQTLLDIEELEMRKKDYGRTEEGLKDKHEHDTHSSLIGTIGTQIDRFRRGAGEFFDDLGDLITKSGADKKGKRKGWKNTTHLKRGRK